MKGDAKLRILAPSLTHRHALPLPLFPSKVTAGAQTHLSYRFLHSTIDKKREEREERRQYIFGERGAEKSLSTHSIFTSS